MRWRPGMDPEAPRLADGGTGSPSLRGRRGDILGAGLESDERHLQCVVPMGEFEDSSPKPVRAPSNSYGLGLCGTERIRRIRWRFRHQLGNLAKVVERLPPARHLPLSSKMQPEIRRFVDRAVVATDPPVLRQRPATLTFGFLLYVWQRRTLSRHHRLARSISRVYLVPRTRNLCAFAHRHGGKDAAEHGSSWTAWARRFATCTPRGRPRLPGHDLLCFQTGRGREGRADFARMGHFSPSSLRSRLRDRRHVACEDGTPQPP